MMTLWDFSLSFFFKSLITYLAKSWHSCACGNLPEELGTLSLLEATGSDEQLPSQTHLTSIPSSVTHRGVLPWFPWSEIENYNVTPLGIGQATQSCQDASVRWHSTKDDSIMSCSASLSPSRPVYLPALFSITISHIPWSSVAFLTNSSWGGFGCHACGLFPSLTESPDPMSSPPFLPIIFPILLSCCFYSIQSLVPGVPRTEFWTLAQPYVYERKSPLPSIS